MVTVRSHLCILPLRLPAPRGSRICPIGDRTIRYTATAAIACYVGHRCDRRSCGAFRCDTPRAHAAARPPMQTRELRRVRTCASPESVPPNHGNVPSILSPSIRAFDDASWSDPEDTSSLLEDSSKLEDFTLVSSGSLQDQGKVPLRFSAAVPVGVGYFAAHHRSPGFRAYSVISPPLPPPCFSRGCHSAFVAYITAFNSAARAMSLHPARSAGHHVLPCQLQLIVMEPVRHGLQETTRNPDGTHHATPG